MPEVINVRFRGKGKAYYFDPAGNVPRVGDDVIVATAKGPELGQCVRAAHFVEDTAVVPPLRAVLRLATEEDQRIARKNREKEEQAFELCQKKIEARGLDMKLVDVEYSFDGSKILFFFTSDGRVDFRELVRTWRACSAPASSCGRSACVTAPSWWAGSASAGGPSAAPAFWRISSP